MKNCIRLALILGAILWSADPARGQSLGNAGTIEGTVVDQTGAAIARAEVSVHNPVSGYKQSVFSGLERVIPVSQYPPEPISSPGQGCWVRRFFAGCRDSNLSADSGQGEIRDRRVEHDGDCGRSGRSAGNGSVRARECGSESLAEAPGSRSRSRTQPANSKHHGQCRR
jgi:hypothetical protein